MGFEVTQLRKVKADLGKLALSATPKAVKAVAAVAHKIEADAKVYAPVDTGNLRNSISADTNGLTAEIGPTAEYGIYVEFGTSRMAPQPYMNPAFYKNVPYFNSAMEKIGAGE